MIYDSLQLLEGSKIVNTTVETGTSFPGSPTNGQLFFRSDTSKMHIYNGTSWAEVARAASAASSVPRITTVTATDSSYNSLAASYIDTAGGYIKIIGANFVSGCSVLVDSAPATTVTFVDSEELRVQVPAKSTGNYSLYVVNPDGGTAIFVSGISYDPVPVWSTAGALGSSYYKSFPISIQLSATENATVTYAMGSGSSLPSGLTLSSAGLLSGTVSSIESATTYSFDIVATDDENQITTRTFTMTVSTSAPVDYLIVAGGGGGGRGGGGAGGYVSNSSVFSPGTYTITVGSGGIGGIAYFNENNVGRFPTNGGNSSINNIVAIGGGKGGGGGLTTSAEYSRNGGSGGSGGGAVGGNPVATGGSGTAGQGNAGLDGSSNALSAPGGGAGGVGTRNTTTTTSTGGPGKQWLNGQFYAGGGGGGGSPSGSSTSLAGGIGGGGAGGYSSSGPNTIGQNGTNGLGGGGGGAAPVTSWQGGNGGSGVVIIRYAGTQKLAHINGGTVSVSDGYVYHTFTSSGTFTVT